MTAVTADPLVLALAGLFVKATLVIGLAMAVRMATARWLSASGRHLVMALAVVMLLALPALTLLLPAWAPPGPVVRSAPAPAIAHAATEARDDAPTTAWSAVETTSSPVEEAPLTRVPWSVVLLAVQVAGTFVMLVHLGVQRWRFSICPTP